MARNRMSAHETIEKSPEKVAASHCPSRQLTAGVNLLQEKWVLLIVHVLLGGPQGFNDMARNAGAVIEQPASFEGDARIVVDASGRSSWSRTKRTRTSERTIAMRGTFRGAGLPRQARVEALEDGWIWGSPMPDGGFAVIACVDGETPHPAYGHLLPASGEKDLVESPSPHFAGRGWREAPGEGCFFAMLRASELFRDLRGEVTVHCHDATTYAAEVVCDETLIRVGDASHSLDPLSSSGIRSAMQSALHASIVINTILRKPERTALALQFYRDTQRAAVEQHIAWTRSFYAESRFRDAPFWRKRSDSGAAGSRPADMNRRAESPPLQKDVTLADGIAIEDVPCIVGDFIEPRRGVTGTTRPFVWICGAEAAALLAPLEQRPMRGEDLLRSWHVRVPRGRELAIFDELVRHGVLTGI